MNRKDALPDGVRAFRVDETGGAVIGTDGRSARFADWLDALSPTGGRERLETL